MCPLYHCRISIALGPKAMLKYMIKRVQQQYWLSLLP